MATDNNTFLDSSSNNLTITKYGNVGQGTASPFSPNYSIQFDGSSFIYDASGSSTAFGSIAGTKFTFECWLFIVQHTQSYNRPQIISNWDNATAPRWIFMLSPTGGSTSDSKVYFEYTDSASTSVSVITTAASVKCNTWNHVALCIDASTASNSTITIYVNGVGQTFTGKNMSYLSTNTLPFYIGGGSYHLDNIVGYMSNIRAVRGSNLVYTSDFTPPTSPLTAIAGTAALIKGNRIYDASSNNYAFNKYGTPKIVQFSPFTANYSAASQAGSAYFDGTAGNYIKTPSIAAFGTGDFTLEFWIYPFDVTTGVRVLNIGISSYGTLEFTIGGGSIDFNSSTTNSVWQINASAFQTLVAHTWCHIAVCRSGNNLYLFANGVQKYTHNVTGLNYSVAGSLYVGWDGYATSDSYRYTGYVSNVRIVRSALYTAAFTVPAAPLTSVANTAVLLKFDNIGIFDTSTNSDIVTFGDAKTQNSIVKSGVGALYFDGTGDYIKLPANAMYNQLSGKAFTIEFWTFPTAWATGASYNEQRTIIGTMNTDSSTGWCINISTSGSATLFWQSKLAGTSTYIYVPIILNRWTHVAVVYDGANISIYLDGYARAKQALTWSNNSNYLTIGNIDAGSYQYYYQGYLDNVQITLGAKYSSDFSVADYKAIDKSSYKVTSPGTQLLITGDGNVNNYNVSPIDSASNATITRIGAGVLPTLGSFSPFGESWGVYFDGTDDRIEFPASANYNLSSGDFTVECWVQFSQFTANGSHIVGTADPWYNANGWVLLATTTNLQFGGTNHGIAYTTNPLKLGKWHHIAVCKQGTYYYLFVDGAQIVKTTSLYNPNNDNTQPLRIGCHPSYPAYGTKGYISNVRVVKGTALYSAPFTVPTANLTAVTNTVLLACQNNNFVDNSSYKAVATAYGSAATSKNSPFLATSDASYNGSVYFNGSGSYGMTDTIGNFNNKAWTIETWVYCTGYNAGTMCIIQSGQGKNSWIPYVSIGVNSAGAVSSCINGAEYFGGSMSLNTWTHVALERTAAGTVSLYLNGVAVISRTDNIDSTNLTFFVGRCSNAPSGGSYIYDWKGYISNLRIVMNASVYSTAFVPTWTPLTAITNTELLTCNSSGFVDSSGKSHVITLTGSPTYTDASPYYKEIRGTSQYLPGSGLSLSYPASANYAFGTGDFTVECFFYFSAITAPSAGFHRFLTNRIPQAAGVGTWSLGMNTTQVAFTEVNTGEPGLVASYTFVPGAWYHIAASRKSGTLSLFVNGQRVGTGSVATNYNNSGYPLYLGCSPNEHTLNGYIANVRIVKGTAVYDPSASYILVPNGYLSKVSGTTLLTLQDNGSVDSASSATPTANSSSSAKFHPYLSGSVWLNGISIESAPASANYAFGTGDFTIEGWYYITGYNFNTYNYTLLITNRVTGNTGPGTWGLTYDFASLQLSFCEIVNNITNRVTASGTVVQNCWCHIAVVRKSGTTTIYVNGENKGSGSDPINYSSSANQLAIGADPNYSGMKGYIHGVRILKGTALYNGNFAVPKSPFRSRIATTEVFTAKFDELGYTDDTGNCLLIPYSTTNKPSTTIVAKSGSTSLYFDGASYLTVQNSNFCFDGDFTVEWWQYQLTAVAAYPTVWALDGSINPASAYNMKMYVNVGGSGHSLNVANTSLNGWSVAMSLGSFPSLNAWHHYAITRNGSTWKVFIDGVQVGTATYAGALAKPADGTFTIGYAGASNSYFKGYIENFKITIGESLYNTAFTPTY